MYNSVMKIKEENGEGGNRWRWSFLAFFFKLYLTWGPIYVAKNCTEFGDQSVLQIIHSIRQELLKLSRDITGLWQQSLFAFSHSPTPQRHSSHKKPL